MATNSQRFLRKPNKATPGNALLTKEIDIDLKRLHVLDGGALLYRVRWPTSVTFGKVCKFYLDHITSKHGFSTIVLDGYSDTPSTPFL